MHASFVEIVAVYELHGPNETFEALVSPTPGPPIRLSGADLSGHWIVRACRRAGVDGQPGLLHPSLWLDLHIARVRQPSMLHLDRNHLQV